MKKSFGQLAVQILVPLLFFAAAQEIEVTSTTSAECDQAIDGEFVLPYEIHEYDVQLAPGDALKVSVLPIGEYMFSALDLYEPAGDRIIRQYRAELRPVLESGILSGRGQYKILIYNYPRLSIDDRPDEEGRAGIYTIVLSCTLREETSKN